jgi:hypothetical protein
MDLDRPEVVAAVNSLRAQLLVAGASVCACRLPTGFRVERIDAGIAIVVAADRIRETKKPPPLEEDFTTRSDAG